MTDNNNNNNNNNNTANPNKPALRFAGLKTQKFAKTTIEMFKTTEHVLQSALQQPWKKYGQRNFGKFCQQQDWKPFQSQDDAKD